MDTTNEVDNKNVQTELTEELNSFIAYCRENGLSDEEIVAVSKPLTNMVTKARIKKYAVIFLIIFFVLGLGYTISNNENANIHISAIGRIILIRMLPFWNWKPLYYTGCLFQKTNNYEEQHDNDIMINNDCHACESIIDVDKISNTNYNEILYKYLIRNAPVVITDTYPNGMPIKKINITEILYENERLSYSVPCYLKTNLQISKQPSELDEIFSVIIKPEVNHWFIHFQNCELKAVKSLRPLAPRPYFISPHVAPSHFNWLIISKEYQSYLQTYKYLELEDGLVTMYQIVGMTHVLLVPRTPCKEICGEVKVDLHQGETLLLVNTLWEVHYLPSDSKENFAIISESDWNTFSRFKI